MPRRDILGDPGREADCTPRDDGRRGDVAGGGLASVILGGTLEPTGVADPEQLMREGECAPAGEPGPE